MSLEKEPLSATIKEMNMCVKIDESYDAYSKFIAFQKSENMSMMDYILEFEHLNKKMVEHEMTLLRR